MSRILVVEDDPAIADLVCLSLSTVGHDVVAAAGTAAGHEALQARDIDLAIVDLSLPDGDGLGLLPQMRERGIPSIILTARDTLADKVRGLDTGADDYMTKPFQPLELIARVRAVLRRNGQDHTTLHAGGISMDVEARTVSLDGKSVELTHQEFDLLHCFMEHRGFALSREKLLTLAWGYDYAGGTRTVDVHVQRLREKLGANRITTVIGTGYRLEG